MRSLSKSVWVALLATLSSEALAGGPGNIVFSSASTIPTLSGTMLVALGLILGFTAIKVMRNNSHNNTAFLVAALSSGAILSTTSGIKVVSSVNASAVAAVPITKDVQIPLNPGDNTYHNSSSQSVFVKNITPPGSFTCSTAALVPPNPPGVPSPRCTVGLTIAANDYCSLSCTPLPP